MFKDYQAGPATAWESLAESALAISRQGESKAALSMLADAIASARRDGVARGEVVSLNCAAIVHSIRGDYWAALASSMDAYTLAQREKLTIDQARAIINLAGAVVLLAPTEEVLRLLMYARNMVQASNDAVLLTRLHNMLGITLGDLGHFDKAALHFDMAMVFAQTGNLDDGNSFDPLRIKTNIASLFRKRADAARAAGDTAACTVFCAEGRAIIVQIEGVALQARKIPLLIDILCIAGLIDAVDNRPGSARQKFAAARKLSIEQKLHSALPMLGIHIGRLDIAARQLESAERVLIDALEEAINFRPSPKTEPICVLLSEVRGLAGDAAGEAHWRLKAAEAKSLFDGLKRNALNQLARLAESLKDEDREEE